MDLRHHASEPERLAEACREAGLKATPQRLAVLRVLLEAHDHPSPELVYRRVCEGLPGISLPTIYRTLESLEQAGLVAQVNLLPDTRRYDANRTPHHHLVCTSCGRIEDHEDPSLTPALPASLHGFRPVEARLQILGQCSTCRTPGRTSRGPR
jgi:Fur family peroxide stress response transcriptional regulator